MLSSSAGWMLGMFIVISVWVYLLIRQGPSAALGAALALSFVFPAWVKVDIGGLPFSIQTSVACIAMIGYVLHPQGKILSPLTILDFTIGMMCIVHIVADSIHTGFTAPLPFLAYGEWVLPYVAGRYAVRTQQDLKIIAPFVIAVLTFLGVGAAVESLSGINPFEFVFGERPEGLAWRSGKRFGMTRAFGATTHPIYFGMLLVILMPWLVCFWQTSHKAILRVLVIVAGCITVAGIFFTLSRTPALTFLGGAAILVAVKLPVLRWPLTICIALAVGGFLLFPGVVTDSISRWTGGGDRTRIIEVDGKAVETSSSRSRMVLLTAYSKAMFKGGLLGYGSKAVSTFPPEIPYMQGKAEASEIKAVDNQYVLITLRFGWLGCFCMVLMFIMSVVSAVLVYLDRQEQLFAAALAATIAVTATFSLFLVWLSYDFGMALLWEFGVISGLTLMRTRPLDSPKWARS